MFQEPGRPDRPQSVADRRRGRRPARSAKLTASRVDGAGRGPRIGPCRSGRSPRSEDIAPTPAADHASRPATEFEAPAVLDAFEAQPPGGCPNRSPRPGRCGIGASSGIGLPTIPPALLAVLEGVRRRVRPASSLSLIGKAAERPAPEIRPAKGPAEDRRRPGSRRRSRTSRSTEVDPDLLPPDPRLARRSARSSGSRNGQAGRPTRPNGSEFHAELRAICLQVERKVGPPRSGPCDQGYVRDATPSKPDPRCSP